MRLKSAALFVAALMALSQFSSAQYEMPGVTPGTTSSEMPTASSGVTPGAISSETPTVSPSVTPGTIPSETSTASPGVTPGAIAGAIPDATPNDIAQIEGGVYNFHVYYLATGSFVKKPKLPDSGMTALKSLPLKVRAFTFPTSSLDFTKPSFRKKTGDIVLKLPENRRKNAVYISKIIYDYITANIRSRETPIKLLDNPHNKYQTASEIMESMEGDNMEKCRLACALLRSSGIPARIAGWKDHYVAEYYLKPPDGGKVKASWHIMDFTGAYDAEPDKVEPVSWFPVDSKELLAEDWKGNPINIRLLSSKNTYLEHSEAEARAIFDAAASGKETDFSGNTALSRFYLLKEMTYEIHLAPGSRSAEVSFTMPLNEDEPLRTMKYFASSASSGLNVTVGRAHTYINPPQYGMVYTLPVKFELKE